MSLANFYLLSVAVVTLLETFALSVWVFSGRYKIFKKKVRRWADIDPEGAVAVWTTGIILGAIAIAWASFWAFPLYFVVWLGYLVTKDVRTRNTVADTLKKG